MPTDALSCRVLTFIGRLYQVGVEGVGSLGTRVGMGGVVWCGLVWFGVVWGLGVGVGLGG